MVALSNVLTNGEVEAKAFVQEPGQVLEEVENARALIENRMYGFDQPPPQWRWFQQTVYEL